MTKRVGGYGVTVVKSAFSYGIADVGDLNVRPYYRKSGRDLTVIGVREGINIDLESVKEYSVLAGDSGNGAYALEYVLSGNGSVNTAVFGNSEVKSYGFNFV